MNDANADKNNDNEVESILTYLEAHPDFLSQHPDALQKLEIPHDAGSATSLVEYQSQRLREKNTQLERKLKELVDIARENEELMERVHRLTLKVMDARDLPTLVSLVDSMLREEFSADRVCILVFQDTQPRLDNSVVKYLEANDPGLKPFHEFRLQAKPLCGRLREEKLSLLFGEDAERIESAALMPLDDRCQAGILGFGSFQPDRFHPGMGTVFLKLMGQVLGRSLNQHLATPAKRRA